jgi:protocatechuate 3,4-dioxygenase, beta subunit
MSSKCRGSNFRSESARSLQWFEPPVNIRRPPTPLLRTPDQILGPFYPLNRTADQTTDLAKSPGRPGRADGELLKVEGQVLTLSGRPVAGARVEIWQANSLGKYRHPSDTTPIPIDPNFDGFAVLKTDREGRYEFRTIKPGAYRTPHGDIRPPHIHFMVDFGADRLITQLYFAGEPENATDRWLQAAPQPDLLIVSLEGCAPGSSSASKMAKFNIILQID